MHREIMVREPDSLGVHTRTVRITTAQWKRCLFSNETTTMPAMRPSVLYDTVYKHMRALEFEYDWDTLIDMRDDAEELDVVRFGTATFPKYSPPETHGMIEWLEILGADLVRVYWASSDMGDHREYRKRLRGIRDAHMRWMRGFPPQSNSCVYFLFPNQSMFLD